MDVSDSGLLSFWLILNKWKAQYILTGDIAAYLHGCQTFADAVEIWIRDTVENRKRLREAFKEYGMGDFFMMERMQFVPGWTYFHLNNGLRLDVMVNVKGLEGIGFEACLKYASIAEIEGVNVPFLHINHLIEAKKAANRPKDQLDVIYLEKIKKLSEE